MSRRTPARRPSRVPAPAPAAAGHRPLLLAVALAAGFAPVAVRAQAVGGSAVVGGMSVTQQGSRQTITTTNGAGGFSAINWQSFSVPGGTTTWFAQPNAASLSINRVTGANPSAIFGTLGSNGRLVLVNPAGIAVGAGAVVDTAGFTASTLRMADADLQAGRLRFDGSAGGLLRVDGKIVAHSGDVVLIGQDVQTGPAALVQSPQGATVLAAGQKVEVTGRGLEGIVFQVQAPTDQAVNLGTLQGDAVGVFAGTLRHSGVVQAQAVTAEGGRVVLKAVDKAIVDGTVRAQGAAGQGGQADVLGAKVGVLAGAVVDTSNTAGGGQIRVGGDYQGQNAAVQNAQVTYVDKDATLRANATDAGNGGKVIVWADDTTRVHGTIEAKAGPNGGDGGFVETSGKRALNANGAKVTAGAVKGQAGTWLLDPSDITIVAEGSDDAGSGPTFDPASGGSTLMVGTLNAAIDGGGVPTNVVVKTSSGTGGTGDIVFDGTTGDLTIQRSFSGAATVTFQADNDIRFRNGTTTFEAGYGASLQVNLAPGAAVSNGVVVESTGAVRVAPGFMGSVNVQVAPGKTLTNDLGSVAVNGYGTLVADRIDNGGMLSVDWGGTVSAGALTTSNSVSSSGGNLTVGDFKLAGGGANLDGGANLTVTNSFDAPIAGGTFDFVNGANLAITQSTGALSIPGGTSNISATGSITLHGNGGAVTVGRDLNTAGGNIWITSTQDIQFTNINSGSSAPSSLGVAGGNVTLSAGGTITGTSITTSASPGSFDHTSPANAGAVSVTTTAGSILVSAINAVGADGGTGGGVYLSASGGDISVEGNIDTRGGTDLTGSGVGGDGGAITVVAQQDTLSSAGGGVLLGSLVARGGAGAIGGSGAGVNVTAATTAGVGDIDTRNGTSSSGTILSSGGSVVLHGGMGLTVNGIDTGSSFDSVSAPLVQLESGGTITQASGVINTPSLVVRGGDASLTGENTVETVAADLTGDFHLRNAGFLTVGSIGLPDESIVTGIHAGSVAIETQQGMSIESPIVTTGGSITLTANASGFDGFSVPGTLEMRSTLSSSGGAITLAADNGASEGPTIVVARPFSEAIVDPLINAGGGPVSIDAPGGIQVSNAQVLGGDIYINKSAPGSNLTITNSTLSSGNYLGIGNSSPDDGVSLVNVTATAGGPMTVSSQQDLYAGSSSLSAANVNLSAAGDLTMSGTTVQGSDFATLVAGVSMNVDSVTVTAPTVQLFAGSTADVPMTAGMAVSNSSFSGESILLDGETPNPGGWGVTLSGSNSFSSTSGTTIRGYQGSSTTLGTGGGLQVLAGDCATCLTVAGSLSLSGYSQNPGGTGVLLDGATISATGPLTVQGYSDASKGTRVQFSTLAADGIDITSTKDLDIDQSSLAAGPGGLWVSASGGLSLSSSDLASTGSVSLSGLAATSLYATSVASNGGDVSVWGGSATSTGTAVSMDSSSLTTQGGSISVTGDTLGNTGVDLFFTSMTSNGGAISVGTGRALWAYGSSLASSGGDIALSAGWSQSAPYGPLSGPAMTLVTSSVHAGSGRVDVGAVGGFEFTANGGATLSGSDVVVAASTAGGTAINIDGETITATNSVTLSAEGGGITIQNGSTITNSGSGPVVIEAVNPAVPGASSVSIGSGSALTTPGDVTVTANSIDVGTSLLSVGGRLTLQAQDDTLAITLGDNGSLSGGTLNLSSSTLANLAGSNIAIGNSFSTGGIAVIGNVDVTTAPSLSLVTGGDITQELGTTLAAQKLNAQAEGSVALGRVDLGSTVSLGVLSGRADGGDFKVTNIGMAPLQIGTVDGTSGIAASPGAAPNSGRVVIETPNALQLSTTVFADAVAGSDALVLAAGSMTTDTGSLAVGQDRWTVYLQGSPTASLTGSPVSGNEAVWNRPYDRSPLLETGNRYVFSDPAPHVTVDVTAASKVYDGTPVAPTSVNVSGLPYVPMTGTLPVFSHFVSYSVDPNIVSKNVGTYSFVLSGSAPSSYGLTFNAGGPVSITPATLVLNAQSDTRAYTGDTASAVAPTYVGLVGGDTVTGLTQSFDSRNVGLRTLAVNGYTIDDGNGGANYVVTSNTAAGSITPAALTISAQADSRTYNGNATSGLLPTYLGAVGGDTVSGLSQSFDSRNAGARTLSVDAGYTVNDGNGGANYTVTVNTAAGAITPATLTISAKPDSRAYDGSALSGAVPTFAGTFASDSVTGLTQAFDSKNAGSRTLSVNGGYTVNDGRGGANYVVALNTAAGSITPAPYTIAVAPETKQYDGTNFAFNPLTVTGLVYLGDTLTVNAPTFDSKNAGARTISTTFSMADGNGGANYAITVVPAAGTITPAPFAINATPDSRAYNGTTASTAVPIVSGTLYGTDTFGSATQVFDAKSAGSRTLSVNGFTINDGNGGANYAVSSATASGTITPATVTLAGLTANGKVYDSTTAATFSGTPSVSVFGSDNVVVSGSATGSFNSKNVGSGKLVTLAPTSLSLAGADAGNYSLVVPSYTANITPATLTVGGLTAQDKQFDGTTAATLNGAAVVAGVFPSDQVTFSASTTGSFNSASVGNGKPVTVTGIGFLGGADAGNYTLLPFPTLTASITPAPTPAPVVGPSPAPSVAPPEITGQVILTTPQSTASLTTNPTDPDKDKDKPKGQPDIVQTDTACKPS